MTQKLTRDQAAIIGLYTGILCGPFEDMQAKAEQLMGRGVWTHEFADKESVAVMKERVKPEFVALCADKDT